MDSKSTVCLSYFKVPPLLFFLVHSLNHLPIGWRSTLQHSVGAYMETGVALLVFSGSELGIMHGMTRALSLTRGLVRYSLSGCGTLFVHSLI
jgi:hypothetical protein